MATKPYELPGLPALPKSLSALLNANSGSWRESGRIHAHRTNIQDSLSSNGNGGTAGVSAGTEISRQTSYSEDKGKAPPRRIEIPKGNLDAALALLRKEMVGLRQLDMSLLSQLWELYEAIQDYKATMSYADSSMDFDTEDSQSTTTPLSPLPPDDP